MEVLNGQLYRKLICWLKDEVEIISFYHLCDKPAFEVDPRVKITYLTEGLKPNRDEIKNAIKSKRPLQLLKECSKSIKILYCVRQV